MYLIEPPFRDRQFDRDLVCDIMGGLRPRMPDSAPEDYKKLAEWCCDSDKRPDADTLCMIISKVYENASSDAWFTIYHNNVRPLSRLEKESKYSSKVLSTGNLSKPRNSYDLDSAAGMATCMFNTNEVNLQC